VVYGPLEQIASLMSVCWHTDAKLSLRPQGLGTHERRKKRNIWRLVLRNVEISHSWSPPTFMSKEAAHASEAVVTPR
jgi:hypothetical protein